MTDRKLSKKLADEMSDPFARLLYEYDMIRTPSRTKGGWPKGRRMYLYEDMRGSRFDECRVFINIEYNYVSWLLLLKDKIVGKSSIGDSSKALEELRKLLLDL